MTRSQRIGCSIQIRNGVIMDRLVSLIETAELFSQ
jgi:hypothetical protein